MVGFFKIMLLLICMTCSSFLVGDSISISGNPPTFAITSAIAAGSAPQPIGNSTTTYNVSTVSGSVKRVTGQLSANMPSGVTLQIELVAPSGGTSAGFVTMTSTAQNMVTAIPASTTATGLTIAYVLSCTVAAAQVTNKTVTLTITVTT